MAEQPLAQWRLRLDVPHKFAIEPGFVREQHSHDFRLEAGMASGTWQDPNTGLVSILPSFMTESFHGAANWKPLNQWLYSPGFWEQVYRAGDPLAAQTAFFFSSVGYQNADLIGTLNNLAIAGVSLSSAIAQDQMAWVMQSQFTMSRDEGFVWFYRAQGDERHHYQNWFSLQWDNLLLVFSYLGRVKVYMYPNNAQGTAPDKTLTPTLIEDFEICLPSDIAGKEGYFAFLPVPGYGLNIYNSLSAMRMKSRISSAQSGVSRGHLVKLPTRYDTSGNIFCHNGGKLSLGMGIRIDRCHQQFGYHQITYTTAPQTWTENLFDPGYKPTFLPGKIGPSLVPNGVGTVTCDLRNADGNAAWVAGTDRQGRVRVTLQTNDTKRTPYVLGTNVWFDPVFSTRDTTPVLISGPDALWKMEFSEDDLGHFEGVATIKAQSAAVRAIVERGDCTFQIEKSLNGGSIWVTHNGGIAKFNDNTDVHGDAEQGIYYVATATLSGMEARFDEYTQVMQMAFDGVTPLEAINSIHTTVGLTPIAEIGPDTLLLTAFKLPGVPQGQNYRFTPKQGDRGDDIIRQLLFLLRTQNVEFRHYYDWKNARWLVDKKPRDTNPFSQWTLTPFEDESVRQPSTVAGRKALFGNGDGDLWFPFRVLPPEANIIQPLGSSSPDASGELIPGRPLYNYASISDKTSVEYLGRAVVAAPIFAPVSDVKEINKMGRRVYDAACHRAVEATITTRRYTDALAPGVAAKIRTLDANKQRVDFMGGLRFWVKRRNVMMDYTREGEEAPTVTLSLSSIWETPLK